MKTSTKFYIFKKLSLSYPIELIKGMKIVINPKQALKL